MPIINEKNIPILKTKEQCRKSDFFRGMCKHINTQMKVDKALADPDLLKGNPDENKAK